jgi:uncharacterized surface protein with fasciclin (FAS1) repeats
VVVHLLQLWVLIDVLLIEEMTYINGSKIILTNVNASNGTVHAIDKVMIATGEHCRIGYFIKRFKVFKSPELTFLVQAVISSGLAPTLSDPNNNFTIYAPTDAAFKAAGFATTQDVANTSPAVLRQVLLNHFRRAIYIRANKYDCSSSRRRNVNLQRVSKWNFYSKSSGITTPANMVIQIFNVVMGSAYYR